MSFAYDVRYRRGRRRAVVSCPPAMPTALLAFMDSQPAGIPDPTVIRVLGDLNTVLFGASSIMTGVLGLAMIGRRQAAPWPGWLSFLVAALNGVAVWIAITFTSYHGRSWNVLGWRAFIGCVSITSGPLRRYKQPEASTVPSIAVSQVQSPATVR